MVLKRSFDDVAHIYKYKYDFILISTMIALIVGAFTYLRNVQFITIIESRTKSKICVYILSKKNKILCIRMTTYYNVFIL